MKKAAYGLIVGALAAMALSACGKQGGYVTDQGDHGAAKELTSVEAPVWPEDFDQWRAYLDENQLSERALEDIRKFSWNTASSLLKDTKENENYSPASLYFALSLAAMGAEGETEEELLQLLEVPDGETLANRCGKLYRLLYLDLESEYGNQSQRNIANSLWLQHGLEVKQDFIRTAEEDFYSSLFTVDFSDPKTKEMMKNWVKDHTGGMIVPEMGVNPSQVLSIINTIYFYDEWTDSFEEENTYSNSFYLEDESGTKVMRDFMRQEDLGSFFVGEYFTRASLGLKESGNMVFVLPKKDMSVDQLLSDPEVLNQAFMRGTEHYGTITWEVPKFSFGQKYELKELMKRLGVEKAFSSEADFSDMTEESVWIDEIRQETHIGIDENGVEAAAYTEILYAGAGIPQESADMILNRPFLYAVMANGNIPVFVGVYRGTE